MLFRSLRNPNFRFDAILEYDEAGREKGIRPQMQAYVNELENAFMYSRLVASSQLQRTCGLLR